MEHVNEILEMRTCERRCFSRLVVSKWNVVFAYSIMKHDCHALLEKQTIVTKATSLVIRVQLRCRVR